MRGLVFALLVAALAASVQGHRYRGPRFINLGITGILRPQYAGAYRRGAIGRFSSISGISGSSLATSGSDFLASGVTGGRTIGLDLPFTRRTSTVRTVAPFSNGRSSYSDFRSRGVASLGAIEPFGVPLSDLGPAGTGAGVGLERLSIYDDLGPNGGVGPVGGVGPSVAYDRFTTGGSYDGPIPYAYDGAGTEPYDGVGSGVGAASYDRFDTVGLNDRDLDGGLAGVGGDFRTSAYRETYAAPISTYQSVTYGSGAHGGRRPIFIRNNPYTSFDGGIAGHGSTVDPYTDPYYSDPYEEFGGGVGGNGEGFTTSAYRETYVPVGGPRLDGGIAGQGNIDVFDDRFDGAGLGVASGSGFSVAGSSGFDGEFLQGGGAPAAVGLGLNVAGGGTELQGGGFDIASGGFDIASGGFDTASGGFDTASGGFDIASGGFASAASAQGLPPLSKNLAYNAVV